MKPASTTRSTSRALEPVAQRGVALGAVRVVRQRRRPPVSTPAAPRPARAPRASARFEATPTTSMPSAAVRPCRGSPGGCALAGDQHRDSEAHAATVAGGSLSTGYAPPVVASAPVLDQLVDAREDVGPAHVRGRRRRPAARRRSCARSSCVRAAVEDLAAHVVRPTAGCARADATDRIASSRSAISSGAGRRRLGHRGPASQTSQQGPAARPVGAVPEVAQDRARAGSVLLDVGPDLAVLAPAGARCPPPATRGSSASRAPSNAPDQAAATRSGAAGVGLDAPGAGQVAHQRSELIAAAADARAPAPRAVDVVARRSPSAAAVEPVARAPAAARRPISSRLMKWTCRALSRFSASSSARAGAPSRPARPASW